MGKTGTRPKGREQSFICRNTHLIREYSKNVVAQCFEFVRSKRGLQTGTPCGGHPIRLAILRYVVQAGDTGAAAGAIQGHVDLPASTLSHHLKRLVDAGLLATRQEGTFHYYAADYTALRALTDYLWEDCCKRGKTSCC
jgi:ArsR family transcriptional regulator, arsenate/arsenite/antimonite-responsive transcriptional repressor